MNFQRYRLIGLMVIIMLCPLYMIYASNAAEAVTEHRHGESCSHSEPDDHDEHDDHDDHGDKDEHDDHDDHGDNDEQDDHDDHGDNDEHDDHDDHGDNDEHDDHDDHGDNDEHDDHDDHGDNDDHAGHDGHEEETGVVELTPEQIKWSGISVSRSESGYMGKVHRFVGELKINSDLMAHVNPPVSGIVQAVMATEGQSVRKGDVLAVINSMELAEMKAEYLEALIRLEQTESSLDRKSYLKREKITSGADWTDINLEHKSAKLAVNSVRSKLKVLGLSDAEIGVLPENTSDDMGQFLIVAPIGGRIIERHITVGESMEGESVFVIADLSHLWADLYAPVESLGNLKVLDKLTISVEGGTKFDAAIAMIGGVADPERRTITLRAVVDNSRGILYPGTFISAVFVDKERKAPVVVEQDALLNMDGSDILFIPVDHGFSLRKVVSGARANGRVEILSGLKKGEKYVAEGAFFIKATMVTSAAGSHAGHNH